VEVWEYILLKNDVGMDLKELLKKCAAKKPGMDMFGLSLFQECSWQERL
jgi:hypothetical protein